MLASQKGRQIFVTVNMAPRFEISKYATGDGEHISALQNTSIAGCT
jgi:hypothetical protein